MDGATATFIALIVFGTVAYAGYMLHNIENPLFSFSKPEKQEHTPLKGFDVRHGQNPFKIAFPEWFTKETEEKEPISLEQALRLKA